MKIKVIQLNAWFGRVPDFQKLTSFLKEQDADVMLFQEVYDGHDSSLPPGFRLYSVFKNLFPEHESVFEAAYGDLTPHGQIEAGNAIFVRGKILSHKKIFFDEPYRVYDNEAQTDFSHSPQTILCVKSRINDIECNLFSLHGIWGFDGGDNERRFQMVDKIIGEVKGKNNVILGGDFNLNPDTQAAKKIEDHLKSVFEESLTSTFNTRRKTAPVFKTVVVDMMFVSSNMKVLEKDCPDVDISDHLPLIVKLEL